MWAIIQEFGGWIISALLAVVAAVAIKKQGKAEAKAEAADQRAADREAIAVRQVNEAREASDTRVSAMKETNDEGETVSRMSVNDVADSMQDFKRK